MRRVVGVLDATLLIFFPVQIRMDPVKDELLYLHCFICRFGDGKWFIVCTLLVQQELRRNSKAESQSKQGARHRVGFPRHTAIKFEPI
jgi:hypothetical protein